MDGRIKHFSVTNVDLGIEKTIAVYATVGWAVKKFAPIFVMVVALVIRQINAANAIAGWRVKK